MRSSSAQEPASPGAWSDHDTEVVIGNLLRVGVLVSAVVVLIGGLMYLRQFGGLPATSRYADFSGAPPDLRTVRGIAQRVAHGDARGVITVGILLLIATPVARVVFSIWAFARERDRLYVGITLIVLAILLFSIFHA
jgi:uncharacterized membrane protein